jgi:peptidoglycan/xylan/chitin deacetylase (PgdA/CDA1 family)
MIPKILLSFDVEEFDMPLEYGFPISAEQQMQKGKLGLDRLMPLLSDTSIQSTLFTTANFANQYPEIIKQLSLKHEIASHTFYHSSYHTPDLKNSRDCLSEIIGKQVVGLRMPRMKQVPVSDIVNAGYGYDASVHPTWLPGRYNNLHLPKNPYVENGLFRIPASVSTIFRIPLFWLSFKNFPYSLYLQLAIHSLKSQGFLSLYFHPWEFVDIHGFNLPNYTIKGCKSTLFDRLNQLIQDLKPHGEFITYQDFARSHSPEQGILKA